MPLYRAGLSGAGATLTTTGNLGLGNAAATSYGIEVLGGDIRLDQLATPNAPTSVTVNGTPGSTTFYYFIVAEDRNGYRTVPSGSTSTSTSQLASGADNTVAFTAVAGATKYYLLRHTASTLPAAPSTGAYLAGTWTSGAFAITDNTKTTLPNFTTNSRNTTADLYVDGCISVAGNSVGANNEVFGLGAFVTGATSIQNTVVGSLARSVGVSGGTAVGYQASATGLAAAVGWNSTAVNAQSVAIGTQSNAGAAGDICIGGNAVITTAGNSIAIGNGATVVGSVNYSIALGVNATVATSNTCVIGSGGQPISTLYVGNGVSYTTASTVVITTTGGLGSDKAGGDMIIAAGKGTGAGLGGAVRIQTAVAIGSGTTSATLIERVKIDQAGNVVLNSGGSALLTTSTDGYTYIPTVAGVPTGTPTGFTGAAAIVYNTTNDRLCVYNPTGTPAWKFVTLGA